MAFGLGGGRRMEGCPETVGEAGKAVRGLSTKTGEIAKRALEEAGEAMRQLLETRKGEPRVCSSRKIIKLVICRD